MSENGNRGNGFDFLIDPYRFGGQPWSETSPPYPVLAEEAFDGVVDGAFDTELVQNLEEFTAISFAIEGAIRDILLRIDPDIESIDSIMAVCQNGSIAQILKVFSADTESIDSITAQCREGAMARILIVINVDEGEIDGFNSVGSVCLGGTIS